MPYNQALAKSKELAEVLFNQIISKSRLEGYKILMAYTNHNIANPAIKNFLRKFNFYQIALPANIGESKFLSYHLAGPYKNGMGKDQLKKALAEYCLKRYLVYFMITNLKTLIHEKLIDYPCHQDWLKVCEALLFFMKELSTYQQISLKNRLTFHISNGVPASTKIGLLLSLLLIVSAAFAGIFADITLINSTGSHTSSERQTEKNTEFLAIIGISAGILLLLGSLYLWHRNANNALKLHPALNAFQNIREVFSAPTQEILNLQFEASIIELRKQAKAAERRNNPPLSILSLSFSQRVNNIEANAEERLLLLN